MLGGQAFSNRAQVSVELIAMLGIALFGAIFFAILASDTLLDIQSQKDVRDARMAARSIADAADYVFAQGDGAMQAVSITLPPTTDFNPNRTYVGVPPSFIALSSPNTVSIGLSWTDLSANSKAPLSGSLPRTSGTHIVNVTSRGTFVSVGGLVDCSPASVYGTMPSGGSRLLTTNLQIRSQNNVVVNITPQWPHDNPSLEVSPSFFYGALVKVPLSLKFTCQGNCSGTHTGSLVVQAYDSMLGSQAIETFGVPLTVEAVG